MSLLDERIYVKYSKNSICESELSKEVKQSVKNDKRLWLERIAASGDWNDSKFLRNKFKLKQGRVKNANGELVDIFSKAETFAEHFETLQWKVRPDCVRSNELMVGQIFNIN